MIKSLALNLQVLSTKSVAAAFAISAAVALPQLFHIIGMVSGIGAIPGAAFLPMQIPVFLAGFLAGPVVGVVVGVISPLISYAILAMPSSVILPYMVLELGFYGLFAGLLCNVKLPFFAKLLTAQVAGRVVLAVALLVFPSVERGGILQITQIGLPGILLQWAFIPLLMHRLKDQKKEG